MPLRSFGGAPYSALPNEVGAPPFMVLGTAVRTAVGELGVNIDAATEGGVTGFYVPSQWRRIGHLYLMLIPHVNGLINYSWGIGSWGCLGLVAGGPTDAQITVDVPDVDVPVCVEIDLTPYLTYLPGQIVNVVVLYRAAGGGGVATDLDFVGAFVTQD